jgi:hypothetical protein
MTDSTIEDRIAARIARVAGARDQVIRTLIEDLKDSIRVAELNWQSANPLEQRALEVLEKLQGGPMSEPANDGADVDRLRVAVADLYRLHIRRGPAWDHVPTREVMENAADLIATFPPPLDDVPRASGFDPEFSALQVGGQISAAVDLGMTPAEARLLVDPLSSPLDSVTLDDPRFAAHPVAQANAASWRKPKRRRKPTRAEKIAAGQSGS